MTSSWIPNFEKNMNWGPRRIYYRVRQLGPRPISVTQKTPRGKSLSKNLVFCYVNGRVRSIRIVEVIIQLAFILFIVNSLLIIICSLNW